MTLGKEQIQAMRKFALDISYPDKKIQLDLIDKVKYKGEECFIFGRRSSGYFDLRKLDGTVIHRSANCKDLKLISKAKTLLWERREGVSSPT